MNRRVLIELPREAITADNAVRVKGVLERYPGDTKVILAVMDAQTAFLSDVGSDFWVDGSPACIDALKGLCGQDSVALVAGAREDA